MSAYVIDVLNPRLEKAMLALGINSEELIRKNLGDFSGRNITENIRNLRFNFFMRKQVELVRQVKALAKEEILKEYERNQMAKKNNQSNDLLLTAVSFPDSQKKTSKYDEIVNKTYLEVAGAFTEKKKIESKLKHGQEIREKAKSELSKKKMKILELKEKQQENFEKIKIFEEKYIQNYDRAQSSKSSPKKIWSRNKFIMPSQTHSRNNSACDLEIANEITKYEAKMQKSKELHEIGIKNKKQAMSKLLEKPDRLVKLIDTNKETIELQRIFQLVSKSKVSESRRFKFIQKNAETRGKLREKLEERTRRAQSKLKEREIFDQKRAKTIERKMENSNSLMKEKHQNWLRELEVKNELQRLKDEESMLNAERKKRIMKYRREYVLEKQIKDSERIQNMKKVKEDRVKKKMENAMRTMRDKERLYEVIASIKKSPECKILKSPKVCHGNSEVC